MDGSVMAEEYQGQISSPLWCYQYRPSVTGSFLNATQFVLSVSGSPPLHSVCEGLLLPIWQCCKLFLSAQINGPLGLSISPLHTHTHTHAQTANYCHTHTHRLQHKQPVRVQSFLPCLGGLFVSHAINIPSNCEVSKGFRLPEADEDGVLFICALPVM